MKSRLRIFLSYGHDRNEEIVQRIKAQLEARGHDVWIDQSRIRFGDDWRRAITDGIMNSSMMLSFLSRHSTRTPSVCLDELAIALGVKSGIVQTILVESEEEVTPPVTVSHIQYLDMHDWKARSEGDSGPYHAWLEEKFGEIVRVLESDSSQRFAGEIQKLRDKLKPLTMDAYAARLLKNGFTGRDWLAREINVWLSDASAGRFFILTGAPGVGKSAFSAWVAHYNKAEILAATFIRHDQPENSKPHRIIRSIAFQLATRLSDYRRLLIDLPELDYLDKKNSSELFSYLLAEPLKYCIAGNRPAGLLLIDALDEATVHPGDVSIAQVLASHADELPDWLRMIATTRPEPGILRELSRVVPRELAPDDARNVVDLEACLRQFLESPTNPETLSAIVARAEGSFLYLREFCSGVKAGDIALDKPETYPKGLTEVYVRNFRRQFGSIDQYAKNQVPLLALVAASFRPLRVEYATAILNLQGRDAMRTFEPLGSMFPIRDGAISAFHKSVIEWLADRDRSGPYHVDPAAGHRLLAERCWAEYLAGPAAMSDYAATFLVDHLVATKRWDELGKLLVDTVYFESECARGQVSDLSRRYQRVLSSLSTDQSTLPRAIAEFFRAFLQQAANAPERFHLIGDALQILSSLSAVECMKEPVQALLARTCCHREPGVRAMAIIEIHRMSRVDYASAIATIRRVGGGATFLGFPRGTRVESLIAATLSLYTERKVDQRTRDDLHAICAGALNRLVIKRLVVWLGPPLFAKFFKDVPSDYNPFNWTELTASREHLLSRPAVLETCRRAIDFIDPAFGSEDQFAAIVAVMRESFDDRDANAANTAIQTAAMSRFFAGDDSALELSYGLWERFKDTDNVLCQDFLFQVRIVQLGLEIRQRAPLGLEWENRIVGALRHFYYRRRSRMKFKTVYICCGVIPAFAFLSRLPGKIGEQIFDEFLAHAIGQDRSGTGETREFCEDAILMRTLEVLGLEYGCYDPYARRLAEHGIVRFLQDEEPLDDFLRSRLAHLLVRARTYHGTDIARLLHTVSSGLRDDIERRMKGVHLQDNPGFLWSMKTEYQLAAVLSEPVTTPSPQRTVYQNMLRHYYSEQTMAAAIRGWAQELITRLSA